MQRISPGLGVTHWRKNYNSSQKEWETPILDGELLEAAF
jgi:hypothetical protein